MVKHEQVLSTRNSLFKKRIEDTKGVIRIRKSKKGRWQHNGRKKIRQKNK